MRIISIWGEWIDVPRNKKSLLKARLFIEKRFLQQLKSFLYKDEQFWIYLKLQNGLIHKYRIVPKNAKDGIWINPYVFNSEKMYQIDQIMFKASNQQILSESISVEWEVVDYEEQPNRIANFFGIGNTSESKY